MEVNLSDGLRVTCVLPVYNGERYLREAIDSVLSQTAPVFETIVIDDGSTDGTPEVIASYGSRVRSVRQDHVGVAAARNRGVTMAGTEFIAFQDADDIWRADRIERQLRRFRARPELQLCSAHLQNFWVPGLEQEAARLADHQLSRPYPGYGTPPSLLVRRSLFDVVGPYDVGLRLASDVDWFIRATESGAVMEVLPEVLVDRRLHTANISRGPRPTLAEVLKQSLDRRRRHRRDMATPLAPSFSAPVQPEER